MSFNSNDDSIFQTKVSSGLLTPSNILRNCLPSQLNFTKNCVFTANLIHGANNELDPTLQLQQIVTGLRPALPLNYTATSNLDLANYWKVIEELPSMKLTVSLLAQSCLQDASRAAPDGVFNISQNCLATANFFYQNLATNHTVLQIATESDTVVFARSVLSGDWLQLSDWTLYNITKTYVAKPQNFEIMKNMAHSCSMDYCSNMGFVGNADIGGIGALVAMWLITLLTTIFVVMSLADYMKMLSKQGKFRNPALFAAFSFWDSVTYLTMATSLANVIYINSWASSVYEILIACFMSVLTFNAALAMRSLYLIKDVSKTMRGDRILRGTAEAAIIGMQISATLYPFARLVVLRNAIGIDYTDRWCYIDAKWPIILCMVALLAGAIEAVWLLVLMLPDSYAYKFPWMKGLVPMVQWINLDMVRQRPSIRFLDIVSFSFMWFNLISLMAVRMHAQDIYGDSFADNSFGYGQIMAMGFILQTTMLFIRERWDQTEDVDDDNDETKHDQQDVNKLVPMVTVSSATMSGALADDRESDAGDQLLPRHPDSPGRCSNRSSADHARQVSVSSFDITRPASTHDATGR